MFYLLVCTGKDRQTILRLLTNCVLEASVSVYFSLLLIFIAMPAKMGITHRIMMVSGSFYTHQNLRPTVLHQVCLPCSQALSAELWKQVCDNHV